MFLPSPFFSLLPSSPFFSFRLLLFFFSLLPASSCFFLLLLLAASSYCFSLLLLLTASSYCFLMLLTASHCFFLILPAILLSASPAAICFYASHCSPFFKINFYILKFPGLIRCLLRNSQLLCLNTHFAFSCSSRRLSQACG